MGWDGNGESRVIGWTVVTLTGHENQSVGGRGPSVDACGWKVDARRLALQFRGGQNGRGRGEPCPAPTTPG